MRSLSVADVSSAAATPPSRNVPANAAKKATTTNSTRATTRTRVGNMPKTRHPCRIGANLRRGPGLAGLGADVREAHLGRQLDRAEHDRQAEPPWPDAAGVEHGQAAIDADEWYVRVPAD